MGWKTINGHRYYYQSVREGKRVRSEYVGGEIGELAALMDRFDREERLARRLAKQDEREKAAEVERALDQLADEGRRLAEGVLRGNGFHQHHRGEWRKRRA